MNSYRELFKLGDRELVSLVGGGGKSTLMFALGAELARQRKRVILTTTTKMGRAEAADVPTICWSGNADCARDALDGPGPVLLVNEDDGHKVTGLGPEVVDQLFADSKADYIVVEADGSRGRPLKAPATHEPVVPAGTTTIVMLVGIDAVGMPLEDAAHRTEQAIAFGGLLPHHILTAADCARILTHPAGLLRACPAEARVVAAITKVDPSGLDAARELQQHLTAELRISDVVLLNGSPSRRSVS